MSIGYVSLKYPLKLFAGLLMQSSLTCLINKDNLIKMINIENKVDWGIKFKTKPNLGCSNI